MINQRFSPWSSRPVPAIATQLRIIGWQSRWQLFAASCLWRWGNAHERFGICWRYWVDGEWPRADDAALRTGDAGGIGHMSDLERLLVPGCTELPACRCGKEMHLDHTLPLPTATHIRVYRCLTCHYEMRLTVWGIDPLDQTQHARDRA